MHRAGATYVLVRHRIAGAPDEAEEIGHGSQCGEIDRAGLATIALAGVGIGIGNIFGSFVAGALRNPAAAPKVFGNVLLGFALTEAIALFALLIALLLLFVF
jgi:F0F1-type ATP synthase membrane subunit c/vacuolar-type H+-ATPase subunit K